MATVLNHPLVGHKMAILRDKNTGTKQFRETVSEISMLVCYEATRDLPTEKVEIETPICKTECDVLSGRKLAVVPILRAGLGMVDGVLAMVPAAKIGHIGLYRNEETLEPVEYFCKLPADICEREVFLVDPMLATGGSACDAIRQLKEHGAKRIRFLCIVAAPVGIECVEKAHPDVPVYAAVVDECLNEHGYIVPGLGDCGDRIFGTK